MIDNFFLLKNAILLGLIGVFGIMDSRLLGRSNFEQPLVLSTLVGLVLGDIKTGLLVGAALQLIFMGVVNIGAAAPPDIIYGSIIATAFVILTPNATNATALTVAIPIAILGQLLGTVLRMFLSGFTLLAHKAIDAGKFGRARRYHIVFGSLLYGLSYFIPIFCFVWLGVDLFERVLQIIPTWLQNGLELASKILPAFGFALLMQTMLSKKTVCYLLLGFFLTAYGNISMIGIAIFAILLALILNELLPRNNVNSPSSTVATNSATTSTDDLEEL